jgi:hypothetical protein
MMESASRKALTMQLAWQQFTYKDGLLTWRKTGKVAGYVAKSGYTQVYCCGRLEYAHRIIFVMFYGYLPDQVDHIDCNRSDSRIENLRPANNSTNQWNRQIDRRNTSGFKGVYWHKQREKWHAEIRVNNVKRSLGLFDTAEEGGRAYDIAAKELHGEYSRGNNL